MTYLASFLSDACSAYYSDTDEEPIISDKEYDKLISELSELEKEAGDSLPWSPTKHVGFTPQAVDKMAP